MKQRIRWAILGTGKIANRFATALKNIPEHAELAAVGSRSAESAEVFGNTYSIDKRYVGYEGVAVDPDIDVVYIGTPGVFHHRDISLCLNAGKHVLCEKALTINAEEAEDVIELARSRKRFLMEAMWTRFFPVHVHIRELLADNVLGELRGLIAPFIATVPADPTNRFYDVKLGAGVLLDLSSYGISWAYGLFGKPVEVTGTAFFGETGADYQSACLLRFAGGQIATVTSSMVGFDVKDATLYGARGKIVVHEPWYKPTTFTLFREGHETEMFEHPLGNYNGYEYEALAVTECIRSGKTECETVPLGDSLAIMNILDDLRSQWGFSYPCEE
jgi:predicted dehydrogenase